MILLRCSEISDGLLAHVEQLRNGVEERVVIALDERAVVPPGLREEILLFSRRAVTGLGLYAPKDFRWRCGDYILYLAAERYPSERFFYLVESDVRIRNPEIFFTAVRTSEADLIAADLRKADRSWYWSSYTCASNAVPFRCLFPIVRVSRNAVVALAERRRNHSRNPARRMLWPNDEAFVATSVVYSTFSNADFNMLLANAWAPETFNFDKPVKASTIDLCSGKTFLYHPVLSDMDYEVKLQRLSADRGHQLDRRIAKRLLRPVLSRVSW